MTRLILAAIALALALPPPARAITQTTPGEMLVLPLDIAIVTTGGVAVTALNVGHRSAGGWIANPIGAITPLCINEAGTAAGTVSAGSVTCIAPGQSYSLVASNGPVSVVASDASHPFSGYGFQ